MSVAVEIRQGAPRLHLWTRDEYYKMAGVGLFDGKHVELIEGKVLEMSPMGSFHANAVTVMSRVLERAFQQGYFLRIQMPLDFGGITEPEPDVAVIAGDPLGHWNAHPTHAVLVVEVAETSMEYDRTEKSSLYARAGIPEYWINNLPEE
ncbi:MAG: Uma2 family endonuclease, partial [Armatimonadetes bacterium]|nr:Uma2 family endonuclease [Armatimonadota bacterium]